METLRKPFQGVINIIRFNWHFFAFALLACAALTTTLFFAGKPYTHSIHILLGLVLIGILVPLAISYYIYDFSGLYELKWLDGLNISKKSLIINIHAGFDETSTLLKNRYPQATLKVYDFYDAEKHTEVSIKRARGAYPPFPGTLSVNILSIPLPPQQADMLLLIFAAHEIREDKERTALFQELGRVLKPNGKIVVVEHIRDTLNFLAYNVGCLHFLSRPTWYKTFSSAGLKVTFEEELTPFVHKFVLQKNGNAS